MFILILSKRIHHSQMLVDINRQSTRLTQYRMYQAKKTSKLFTFLPGRQGVFVWCFFCSNIRYVLIWVQFLFDYMNKKILPKILCLFYLSVISWAIVYFKSLQRCRSCISVKYYFYLCLVHTQVLYDMLQKSNHQCKSKLFKHIDLSGCYFNSVCIFV